MLLAAVSTAVVLGAEPQCPGRVDIRSCEAGYDSGRLSLARRGALPPPEATDVLCRPEAQAHRDSCHSTCALRLVVTSPAEYAFSACLQEASLTPFVREAHIDELHPLRGKELPVVKIGGTGCNEAMWSREKHEGKIVFGVIGDGPFCLQGQLARLAASVRPAALILGFMETDWTVFAASLGTTWGTIPVMFLSRHYTDLFLEATVDKGLSVTGYLDLVCDASPATPPPTLPVTDNCPSLSLVGKCSNQADPEHRLCNRCPQQLSWGGKSVCLWGNGLVPRDGRNHLKSVLSLPADVKAVFIESPTRVGCSRGEFAGLAGTVVFVEQTVRVIGLPDCSFFYAARNAEAEGVLAYVSVVLRQGEPLEVSGPSKFVMIPVHTTMPSDYDAVLAMFHAGKKEDHLPGRPRYVLRNARIVDEAVADPYRPANVSVAEKPVVMIMDTVATFRWTVVIIVSLVVIVLMTVLIARRVRLQYLQSFALAGSVGGKVTVPLSVASMGLSISLVLTVAVVAFLLAKTAGQRATDTALDDGRAATAQTYRSAQQNAEEQAHQTTKVATKLVAELLVKTVDTGEKAAEAAAKVYKDTDTSWTSWDGRYQAFIDAILGYCCQNTQDWFNDWYEGWTVSMLSVKGFYADQKNKIDGRARPGVDDVSVTEDGYLYGLGLFLPIGPHETSIMRLPLFPPGMTDDPRRRIGMWPGDKHAAVAGQRSRHNTWRVTRDSLPWSGDEFMLWSPLNPVSVLTPVYSRVGTYLGVVEAMMDVGLFAKLLEETLSSDSSLANVTIVVLDKATSSILIDTNRYYSRVRDQYVSFGTYTPHHQLISLQESLAIENNALSHYLKTIPDVGSSHTGQFDQAELYHAGNSRVFDVRASSGGVTDVSGNVHGVENQGGSCGGCTAPRELWDGRTGEVMVFDGANSMLIYQNLTTDVPHVAATRRGSGAWDSSVPLYQTVRPLAGVGGGTEQQCVVRADLFTPFVNCMLRGHNFDKPYAIVARFKPSADVSEADRTQQIFTEASVGETSVRMYANGAAVLNAVIYGCSTKPVEGGTKGGEWVSVAFVRTATNCTTFVNGKLWDTNLIVPNYVSGPHGVPFEVGAGFVGEISSVQMLNVTVNEEEATGLHETDVFVRDVPSKTWLLEIGRIRREDLLHTGLDWIVATMIPRADVMRRVDENNRVMLHNLEVQEDNTKKKLIQETSAIVFVVVVLALACVFVFLVFNDLLTRPFAQVCVVMADAAVMRIEEIPDTSSRILEINAIHSAMVLMTRNLKEYKAYMPQSVLAHSGDDQDSVGSGVRISLSGSSDLSSLQTLLLVHEGNALSAGIALSITQRRCTFLVLNLVDFHAKMSVLSEKKVVTAHGRVVECVLSVVVAAKGICDGFSGDRFLSSFNAVRGLSTHRVAGCTAGVVLRNLLRRTATFEISSAVVCGDARVGNMGCEVMRKYTFVSPVLSWGFALERYARSLSYPVLADHFIVSDVGVHIGFRTVGQVVFEKRLPDGQPLTISCALAKRDAPRNEEWMYALEEMETSDPQAAWNKFATAVFNKNWEVCVDTLRTPQRARHPQEAASLAPSAPDSSDVAGLRLMRALDECAYTPDIVRSF